MRSNATIETETLHIGSWIMKGIDMDGENNTEMASLVAATTELQSIDATLTVGITLLDALTNYLAIIGSGGGSSTADTLAALLLGRWEALNKANPVEKAQ